MPIEQPLKRPLESIPLNRCVVTSTIVVGKYRMHNGNDGTGENNSRSSISSNSDRKREKKIEKGR
jgi:hypothetical protein